MTKRSISLALGLVFALAGHIRADTIRVCVRESDGTPIVMNWRLVFRANLSNVIANAAADAAGCASIVDAVNGGENPPNAMNPGTPRCITGIGSSGWTFSCTPDLPWSCIGCGDPFIAPGANYCLSDVTVGSTLNCTGRRQGVENGKAKVFGGRQGYVNPGVGEVATVVVLPRFAGPIILRIYTIQGRLIATKEIVAQANVQNELTWNGRTDSGDSVPSGIYITATSFDGITQKGKIAILRK